MGIKILYQLTVTNSMQSAISENMDIRIEINKELISYTIINIWWVERSSTICFSLFVEYILPSGGVFWEERLEGRLEALSSSAWRKPSKLSLENFVEIFVLCTSFCVLCFYCCLSFAITRTEVRLWRSKKGDVLKNKSFFYVRVISWN